MNFENIKSTLLHHIPYLKVWSLLLMSLGMAEAAIGLLQIYGFSGSNHALYTLTGSFRNPRPYSGFLAMLLPIAIGMTFRSKGGLYYIALLAVCLTICVLSAGMSRTAWIAASVSCAWLVWILMCGHGRRNKGLKKHTPAQQHKRRPWIIVAVIVVGVAISGMYLLKQDSANGRFLYWKIASMAIANRPWTGYGAGRFAAAYAETQETYFAKGEYAAWEEWVAGTPEESFNEYLRIGMEHGAPAMILFLAVVIYTIIYAYRQGRYGMAAAMMSFAIFALASYPLQEPLFLIGIAGVAIGCLWPANLMTTDNRRLSVQKHCTHGLLLLTAMFFIERTTYREWQHELNSMENDDNWHTANLFLRGQGL